MARRAADRRAAESVAQGSAASTRSALSVDVDPERPLARLAGGRATAIVAPRRVVGVAGARVSADSAPGFRARACSASSPSSCIPVLELYVIAGEYRSGIAGSAYLGSGRVQQDVAAETGRFYTLGMPEDTSALRQGVFTLPEFLGQSRLVLDEERRLLDVLAAAIRRRAAVLLFLIRRSEFAYAVGQA